MDLHDLLQEKPMFHRVAGQMIPIQLADEDLILIDQQLEPGTRTLETGAGLSTLVFALNRADHTCITPVANEVERIRDFARERRISLDTVEFIVDQSEYALPALRGRQGYELALIDGRHGFPAPFIDWYYISDLLAPSATVIIDDLHLWTPHLLLDFLKKEPGWKLVRETSRVGFFVMETPGTHDREFTDQPYVLSHSRATSLLSEARYLMSALICGDFKLVWHPFGQKLRDTFQRKTDVATKKARKKVAQEIKKARVAPGIVDIASRARNG